MPVNKCKNDLKYPVIDCLIIPYILGPRQTKKMDILDSETLFKIVNKTYFKMKLIYQ